MLGKTIALRAGVLSVIGVMPPSFFGETVGERPDAWVPLAMHGDGTAGAARLRDVPGSVEKIMWPHGFGRLRPGVGLEQAQANANVVFQHGLTSYYGTLADEATRKRFLDQRLRFREASAHDGTALRNSGRVPAHSRARRE